MALAGLLALALPFLGSLALGGLARRLAPRLGFVDAPGGRKAQAEPVPLGGGLAVAGGLGLAALAAALVPGWLPAEVRGGLEVRSASAGWILAAAGLLLALGIWDDLRELGAVPKLAVQLVACVGTAVLVPEARIQAVLPGELPRILLTAGWLLLMTNAFNFLDNMDGLAAGVAAIAAGTLAALAFLAGRELMAGFFLALCGALGGFLVHNAPPARLYLGDAGSLVTGFLLAAGASLFTYDSAPGSLAPVGTPLLVFGVPLFDAASVLLIRLREGRPLMRGDRSHFSHRLVSLGLSPREAVGTIWTLTFVTGVGALLLSRLPSESAPLLLAQAVGVLLALALFERAARRRRG